MRFLNEDPLRSGQNWQNYVGGNVVNMVDPTGYDIASAFWGYAKGAAVGGATAFAIGVGLASPIGWVAGGTALAATALTAYSGYSVYDTFSSGAYDKMAPDQQDEYIGSLVGGIVGAGAFGSKGYAFGKSRLNATNNFCNPSATLLNEGHQGKHIFGHNNFNIEAQRSVLTHKNPQNLLNQYGGKGQKVAGQKGSSGYRERVDFGEDIGWYVDNVTGNAYKTTKGIIHYGKNGAHIVPSRP
jgi:hypothetical protein